MSLKTQNAINLYLKGIRDGNYREAVHAYTGDQYKQHSTGVKDGAEGFIEFFSEFVARNSARDIQIVRALEENEFVFLHVYQNINNGETEWVTTDFFRTDANDKIIEHWDVIAPYHAKTLSGRTSIDGPTEITDLGKTTANKALVHNLIKDGFMRGGNPANLPQYLHLDYKQHNPEMPDGRDAFIAFASKPDRPLNYDEIVLTVAQGNFVAVLSKANWKDSNLDQNYAQVDLFRIENSLVVEHWDNVEPVPEVSVNSGKF